MLKCIVWDLDDTVWNGEIRTSTHVILNQNAVEIIKAADTTGIIQSIASRNELQPALRQLSEFGIDKFFIFPQIDLYRPKVSGIRKIAERFNIDPSCIAFVDDNPFERYEVNRYIPEVFTYGTDELNALCEQIAEINGSTVFTANRRELMLIREKRLEAEQAFNGSREEFLRECKMRLTVREAHTEDLSRVSELTFRTNKLNNLREPMSIDTLENYMIARDKYLYVCELEDIFGEHGIVGACLLRTEETRLCLDLFCISCRTEGRGIGTAFLSGALGAVISAIKKTGNEVGHVHCRYKIYEKDKSALMLLKLTGFYTVQQQPGETEMCLNVPFKKISPPWLELRITKGGVTNGR